jgi:hypothetical protein
MPKTAPAAFAAFALLGSSAALADTCPWLDAKVAAEVILVAPNEIKLEKNPVVANDTGLIASTTCRFSDKKVLVGGLSVMVLEYRTETGAKAAYERELSGTGGRVQPAKIEGNAAFMASIPGLSGTSWALKGKKLVRVAHVFSKQVNDSIASNPDGAVLSTHEIARQVLAKL